MPDLPRFGYHFAVLHRQKLSLCKKDIAELGLQIGQMPFLLALLKAERPMTQDELSNQLIIDKSATTRALDRLEKQGFVSRQINPDCRRQNLVVVTSKARDISPEIFKILGRSTEIMTRGFTADELELLQGLMNRMITNANTELEI